MFVVRFVSDVGENDKTCFARKGRRNQKDQKSKDKRGRHEVIEYEIPRSFERNRSPERSVLGRNPGCALLEQSHNGLAA